MAQPFVVTFSYDGNTYTAEVNQVDGSLSIFLPDQRLHHILPDGKVTLHLEKGMEVYDEEPTPRQDLLLSILGAMDTEKT